MGAVGFGLAGTGRRRGDTSWGAAVVVVLALALSGLGVAALVKVSWDRAALHLAARDWPVAQAKILDVRLGEQAVAQAGGGDAAWRLVLSARYVYEVDGASYVGTSVSLADVGDRDDRRLKSLYSRLHFARVTGRTVAARYDPAAPETALLDNGFPWRQTLAQVGLGVLGLLAGTAMVVGVARRRRAA